VFARREKRQVNKIFESLFEHVNRLQ